VQQLALDQAHQIIKSIMMNIVYVSVAICALTASKAIAFAPHPHRQQVQRSNTCRRLPVEAHNSDNNKHGAGNWVPAFAAAVVGWTMASQVALAAPPPPIATTFTVSVTSTATTKNSLASMFEEKPAPVYEKLDFSLPSYESSKSATGFGEGTEVRTKNLAPSLAADGSDQSEQDKQREAMVKAEAARKARVAQAKELTKMREAEDQLRAQAKKEEAARRMRGIFD
jgi:hypothetical protein